MIQNVSVPLYFIMRAVYRMILKNIFFILKVEKCPSKVPMVKIPPSESAPTQPQIQEAMQVPGESEQTNGLPTPTHFYASMTVAFDAECPF